MQVFADGANKMYKVAEIDELAGRDTRSESDIQLTPAESGTHVPIKLDDSSTKTPSGGKGDTVITAEGISIFDDEDLEIEAADPMAKTQIAPSLEDQISLEGVGSGSGLLDLTRESDDTSLAPRCWTTSTLTAKCPPPRPSPRASRRPRPPRPPTPTCWPPRWSSGPTRPPGHSPG